jgi:hypothetical protein
MLSDSDIKALAESPSHLTAAQFSALTPKQQGFVCDSRAFVKRVDDQKGVINAIGNYGTRYLSPAENDRIVDATNQYLWRIMKSKGL